MDTVISNEALAALKESEARFRLLVEGCRQVFFYQHDAECRFTYVSPSVIEVLGYEPGDLLGEKFDRFQMGDESKTLAVEMTNKALTTQERQPPYIVGVRHKTGALIHLEIVEAPTYNTRGELTVQGFAQDVTYRLMSERNLRLSRQILDTLNALILVGNSEGQVIYVNPSVQRILGFSPRDVLGYGWWRLTRSTPEAQREACENVARYARGELPPRQEVWEEEIRDADGRAHWFVWQDTKGPEDLLIGVGQDVTELKRMNEKLREKERQAKAIFDGGVTPMFILNDDFTYEDANTAGCSLLGVRKEELIGTRVGAYSPHPENALEVLRKMVAEGGLRTEIEVIDRNGKTHAIEFTGTANILPGKHLSVLRDVTEHKVLQEQFLQAQKMEAVGRLAGGVAHDFNNMLTAIRGYSELLQRNLAPEHPLRRYADGILDAADRATLTTQQLLAFSRRQVVQPQPLNLNNAVLQIGKLLRRLIGEDVALRMSLAPDLGIVKADPGQIGQILLNLAVNARDAMPHGGTLSIETTNVQLDDEYASMNLKLAPGTYVVLSVADTGCGMERNVVDHIFEPFFTTKGPGKGTGLGLPTVYGIVEQAGGAIHVYSEVGEGTTFRTYLPMLCEERHPAIPQKRSMQRGIVVMLLEDDPEWAHVVAEALRETGFEVLVANTGAEALRLSESNPDRIDLLLADITLPGTDGRDVAGLLAIQQKNMRTIFMSGFAMDSLHERGLLPQDAPFIQKPFALAELVKSIEGSVQIQTGGPNQDLFFNSGTK